MESLKTKLNFQNTQLSPFWDFDFKYLRLIHRFLIIGVLCHIDIQLSRNLVSTNMKVSFYVFGFLMRPRFLCQSNDSIIVTIERNQGLNGRNNSKFDNEPLNPKSFFSSIRCSYILGFCSRINSDILLGTLLAHCTSITNENKPRDRLSIIYIWLEIRICETIYL